MANIVKQPCDEGVIRAGRATAPCAASAAPWVLAATILGSSMAFIDGTAVNVALPALQEDLRATENRASFAGAEMPPGLSPETQTALGRVMAESFVSGFRLCMAVAAALALLSALSGAFMIRGRAAARYAAQVSAPA